MSKGRLEQQEAPGVFSRYFAPIFAPIIILIGFLYHDVVGRMAHIWITDSDQAHGLLLVAVAGYLVFYRRKKISRIKPETWIPGLVIMVGAMALLLMGQVVVEYFVMRASLIFLLAGIIGFSARQKCIKNIPFPSFPASAGHTPAGHRGKRSDITAEGLGQFIGRRNAACHGGLHTSRRKYS